MPREKLYDPNNYLPSGKEYTGLRHQDKTRQDKERDVTARPRVQAWQRRLTGAKVLVSPTEDSCDTQ